MTTSNAVDSQAGYLLGETILLTTNPTGASYSWALARPPASGSAALNDDDVSSVRFIPDVAGTYVATCNVAGTQYILTIDVAQQAASSLVEALRLPPRTDEQITAPAVGYALYNSSTQGKLAVKDSDDNVFTIELTAV